MFVSAFLVMGITVRSNNDMLKKSVMSGDANSTNNGIPNQCLTATKMSKGMMLAMTKIKATNYGGSQRDSCLDTASEL